MKTEKEKKSFQGVLVKKKKQPIIDGASEDSDDSGSKGTFKNVVTRYYTFVLLNFLHKEQLTKTGFPSQKTGFFFLDTW